MTGAERADLADLRSELFLRLDTLDDKIDVIESRLDRWDGAITLVKATASLLGVGGIALVIGALAKA